MKRPAGFMSDETYTKIVKQCADHGTAIRFIQWGEPLLHDKIIQYVAAASVSGLLTHINSNGSLMDDAMINDLINAGLSSLKLSFQGVDRKSYEEMRGTDYFEGLLETAARIKAIRGNRPLPYLHISTSITYESPEIVAAFRERASKLVDFVSVGRTTFDYMNWKAARLRPRERAMLERLAGLQTVDKRHPSPCPEIYNKLSIHYDGTVRVCCNDYDGVTNLGNVNDTPLSEIWRHKQIEDYRKTVAKGEYTGPLCSNCFDYMDLTKGA